MAFGEIDPRGHKFWLSARILEGVRAENLEGNNIICQLYQGLWLHTQSEDGPNTNHLWPAQRNRRSHNDAI